MAEFTFHQPADAHDWAAYRAAEKALAKAGFSVGSMQRGCPTAAMFGEWYVSKWLGMTKREQAQVHALIEGSRGTFRSGPIKVTLRPECPAAGVEAFFNAVVV